MFTSRWTENEKKALREHFRHIPASQISKILPNRSPGAVNDMARNLGIRKSPERLQEMGREIMTEHWRRVKSSE